jgi:hypothetical protein
VLVIESGPITSRGVTVVTIGHSCASAEYRLSFWQQIFSEKGSNLAVGRPAKHPNEYVLTRWFIADILARADDEDRRWLSNEIGGFRGNLGRYKKGKRGLNWQDPRGLVSRLDKRFAGCAEIFRGTTGQLLMEKPVTQTDLLRAIRALDDPHRTILLAGGYGPGPSGSTGVRTIDDVLIELEQFPEYRTIQAIVYLLAWADRVQNHDTWNSTCLFYRRLIPKIMYFQQVPHYNHIFDAIDAIAPFREFTANVRRERYSRWKLEISEFKKLRKGAAIEIMNVWNETPKHFIGGQADFDVFEFDEMPSVDEDKMPL